MIISVLIAVIFFISFFSKLFEYKYFLLAIKSFGLLTSNKLMKAVAVTVLLIEGMCASCLSLRYMQKQAYVGLIILLLVFTTLFFMIILQGRRIQCNCFGQNHRTTNNRNAIIRNIIIITLCMLGYFNSQNGLVTYKNLYVFLLCLTLSLSYQLYKEMMQYKQILSVSRK